MNMSDLNVQSDSLEFAGNLLDRHDFNDTKAPSLLEVINFNEFHYILE